jgi:hypothetical protein
MRTLTRQYVDAAFRILRIKEEAMSLPGGRIAMTFPGDLIAVTKNNSHDQVEMIAAFSTWAAEGAPLVSLSEEMAEQLSATDPPEYLDGRIQWKGENVTLMIEAGRCVVFAWLNGGYSQTVCYRERGTPIPEYLVDERQAHVFLQSVLYILETRPEGLIVTETKPSAKAARKAARKFGKRAGHLPGTLYVIGPDAPYQARERQRDDDECERRDRDDDASCRPRRARHHRRGHYRHQAWGKGHALRKVIWIAPKMIGNSDAPTLVRARRLDDTASAPVVGLGSNH